MKRRIENVEATKIQKKFYKYNNYVLYSIAYNTYSILSLQGTVYTVYSVMYEIVPEKTSNKY